MTAAATDPRLRAYETTLAATPPTGTYPPGKLAAALHSSATPSGLVFERYDETAAGLHSSPSLTPDPGPPPLELDTPRGRAAQAGHLDDPIADAFHLVDCACADPYAVAGHAEQYAPLADMTRKTVLAEIPGRAPIEAKVLAGGKGALWAGIGLSIAQVLLTHLGAIGSVYGGEFPWLGGVLVMLGVFLPAVVSGLQGYNAPHTPRTGVQR